MPTDAAKPLVLLLEDDDALRLTTRLVLERQGFDVITAGDGIEGLEQLEQHEPAVAVVDVVMPRMDGLTFVRRALAQRRLGIVMLTARDLPSDQLVAFGVGADDYIVKPFDGELLAARIRAVLRRVQPEAKDTRVRLGELVIDREGMAVERAGEPVSLSSTEFRLLMAFLDHPGHVLSHERLLELVWGTEWGDGHVVTVTMGRLRSKIGTEHLVTVRGAGYKLVRG